MQSWQRVACVTLILCLFWGAHGRGAAATQAACAAAAGIPLGEAVAPFRTFLTADMAAARRELAMTIFLIDVLIDGRGAACVRNGFLIDSGGAADASAARPCVCVCTCVCVCVGGGGSGVVCGGAEVARAPDRSTARQGAPAVSQRARVVGGTLACTRARPRAAAARVLSWDVYIFLLGALHRNQLGIRLESPLHAYAAALVDAPGVCVRARVRARSRSSLADPPPPHPRVHRARRGRAARGAGLHGVAHDADRAPATRRRA